MIKSQIIKYFFPPILAAKLFAILSAFRFNSDSKTFLLFESPSRFRPRTKVSESENEVLLYIPYPNH